MPIAYEAISNTTYASRTNTTIAAAGLGTIADNDLLLLLFLGGATTEAPDPTPPTGFTICPGAWPTEATGGSFNVEYRAYYKYASGESGNYTVTHASASSQGAILRFSGAKLSSAFNPTPTTRVAADPAETDSTAPGLTTAADGTMIVWNGHSWGDTTTNLTPPTGTTPTFTERLDTLLMYVATGVLTTAGATGDKTMANNSSGNSPWVASLIAIEPAADAPAIPPILVMPPMRATRR